MILALASDKGSPGVTTLAMALGLSWPKSDRVVVEADPAGADLPFRVSAGGKPLMLEPSLAGFAAAARTGIPGADVLRYSQVTSLGVPVIPGPLSPELYFPLRTLLAPLSSEAAKWSGTVIADVGRLQPGSMALPLARAATAVLLVTRADLAGLYHLRDRVLDLQQVLGDQARSKHPLMVVVRHSPQAKSGAVEQVRQMLAAIGSPIKVLGGVSDDEAGTNLLWAGEPGKRLTKSALIRSAARLTESLGAEFPEFGIASQSNPMVRPPQFYQMPQGDAVASPVRNGSVPPGGGWS